MRETDCSEGLYDEGNTQIVVRGGVMRETDCDEGWCDEGNRL